MHQGVLINSKTEWFSPSIVRTTIEKGGVEMTYEPAKGSSRATFRSQSSSLNHPRGRTQVSDQPVEASNHPAGRTQVSNQPMEARSQPVLRISVARQPQISSSQPALPLSSARDDRMRKREMRSGTN